MAKSDTALFVDTNIIVYASEPDSPFHERARAAVLRLDADGRDLWISRQIVREYLSAMTRGGRNADASERRMLIEDARTLLQDFNLAEETDRTTQILLSILESRPVCGVRIHDANIVATMLACGIRSLLTENTGDFSPFGDLIELINLSEIK
jgi:predicted nucleic acid-binding protein